jgi:polyribonucleotide nucleotidyltransferase
MATTKVKGTSKKIKELKGIEDIRPEKITDEQLEKVQSVINEINRAQMELGQMETKKHAVLHHISSLQEAVGGIREEFEKEYGTADVNIQDGIINYPKENGEVNKED